MSDDRTADPWQIIAELRRERDEAIEQQAAITKVLQIINSSPGDLAPVFDAMLEKAMRLCEAPAGYLRRYNDGKHTLAASRSGSEALVRYLAETEDRPEPDDAGSRLLVEPYVHVINMKDDDAYRSGSPIRRALVDVGGVRTGLAVPLRKDGE